jgi:hypothetical protein
MCPFIIMLHYDKNSYRCDQCCQHFRRVMCRKCENLLCTTCYLTACCHDLGNHDIRHFIVHYPSNKGRDDRLNVRTESIN